MAQGSQYTLLPSLPLTMHQQQQQNIMLAAQSRGSPKVISIINRCKATCKNPHSQMCDQSHTKVLKYKPNDEYYDKQIQNSMKKSDKELLNDFLQEGKQTPTPSEFEELGKIVK